MSIPQYARSRRGVLADDPRTSRRVHLGRIFASRGLWNLFYYPNLNQWFSLAGGATTVSVNIVWFALTLKCWRSA